jgi:membrane associated rhomboid family serine protease
VAAQNGVFGLLSMIAVTFFIVRLAFPFRLKKSASSIIFVGLSAAFVCSFIYQGLTGSFENARHLWVLIGLILSAQQLNNTEMEKTSDDLI